ncbi:hypothetical protein IFM89_019803 [Coptis chinensis]|uniref:Protein kinase domain-containing protein n=1 Tax=Coptis chinensis TaxID=261450 RepID=A0A835I951_9MAGN|nr:hypothetical protein IFM89_019803 [Coptis chinensis]
MAVLFLLLRCYLNYLSPHKSYVAACIRHVSQLLIARSRFQWIRTLEIDRNRVKGVDGGSKGFIVGAGKSLMSVKASFSNVVNVLLDWDDVHNGDHCSWRGVSCDNHSFSVVSLNLSNLNLGGEISPSIGDLRNLQSIDLKGNHLTGQIPDEIGNCGDLRTLDLSGNLLYGDIPFSISKLKQLEELNLKNNQLTGPIPSTLSQIPNLKNLDVRGNNLTGTIPDNIGNCTSFEILDISYNQITGEIPYNIGFLQVATLLMYWLFIAVNATRRSLQGNRLSGKIPEVIGLMQALAVLDLSENELVGPIPPILGNLSYTGKLYLHGNKLTGNIPPELGNMSKLSYLQLNDNLLVGRIPAELGQLGELFELNLASNYLEGPIPKNISSCTALNQLNVYGNRLNGSIPSGFQNLDSLTSLNLSSNYFKGRVPVELGRIVNLDTLDLSNNDFSGPVPASVGDLEHLLRMNLSRNYLDGPVPAEFGNLRSIQILDMSFNKLSGKIPVELGQLQNINTLMLRNNNLHGGIPVQLTNCFSLNYLDISFNNFSGDIPSTNNFSRFPPESFSGNPLLCGNWLGSVCGPSERGPKGPPKLVILHMDMAVHTYEDIMRVTENLSAKYIIGYGATSTVYKCILKNSKVIAVKRLYSQYTHNSREFETELETIGSIKHRNLVCLHGYSLSPNGNLLFYDYMPNGSLWDLLHDDNTVMEAVDQEVSITCMDLGLVRKTFQLALLCTKKHPSERPNMHEVARVLVSLLPPPVTKPSMLPTKALNYTEFVANTEAKKQPHQHHQGDNSASDAQWFVRFGEVISKNSL